MDSDEIKSQALQSLEHGGEFPYDAPDEWWNDVEDGNDPSLPVDFAHAAARGIIADLKDRRGIKRGFDGVSEEVRVTVVAQMAEIIRQAQELFRKPIKPVQPPGLTPDEIAELEAEESE